MHNINYFKKLIIM